MQDEYAKEAHSVANNDVPLPLDEPLTWSHVRSVDAVGNEVEVRRLGVPGGWLYQVRPYVGRDGDVSWSQPVFVEAPPVPVVKLVKPGTRTITFATTDDAKNDIYKADVVVDLKSGTIVKSRYGKSFMLRDRQAKAKPRRKR